MRLIIDSDEYWIRDGIEFPSNFDSMDSLDKERYIYYNNLLHREDGPAIIWSDGYKEWYLNGLSHRINGPAIIWPNGYQSWWLNGFWVDGKTYQKIQNSSKEKLLVYMINSEYKYYLPLIEYRLNQ